MNSKMYFIFPKIKTRHASHGIHALVIDKDNKFRS